MDDEPIVSAEDTDSLCGYLQCEIPIDGRQIVSLFGTSRLIRMHLDVPVVSRKRWGSCLGREKRIDATRMVSTKKLLQLYDEKNGCI
jgi:hypothetical protein